VAVSSGNGSEALWRESSTRLRAWFERSTGSAADAEDLLQETFVRVHEGLDALADAASVRAWVGTIARNVLAGHFRRRGAHAAAELAGDPAAPTADESLERTVASWLEAFLTELDPDDAEALRLVDLEGGTQAELAARHWLTLSGAKSRVQRARERLRSRLEACCSFAFDARGGILSVQKRSRESCRRERCD
jgi:RNA polymerase sigma-70 factor (ECF subfamily)